MKTLTEIRKKKQPSPPSWFKSEQGKGKSNKQAEKLCNLIINTALMTSADYWDDDAEKIADAAAKLKRLL